MLSVQAGRRDVLRWGGLLVLAAPLVACNGGYDDSPDPLSALAAAARADARAARRLGGPAGSAVAALRTAQATALQSEVDRANRPPAATPKSPAVQELPALGKRLVAARERATSLLGDASPFRAGLLASVAAGCAGALSLDRRLGSPAVPRFTAPGSSGSLEESTVDALQQALDSEHASVWVYGQVSAFLPAIYDKSLREAIEEHQDRREATQEVLSASGATPVLAEAAYVTPKPVTNEPSARAAVIAAESDAARAWLGVVERAQDPALRALAADAMAASAIRGTRWRKEAGLKPPATPLPGR